MPLNDYTPPQGETPFQCGDKRKHLRFPTRLKALYYVNDEHEGLGKCDIVNVSYGGLGLAFTQAAEVFGDSKAINLGIVVKCQFVPISLKGRVKWWSEGSEQLVGGVELDVPLDNTTLLELF